MFWWFVFGLLGSYFALSLVAAKFINRYWTAMYFAPPGAGKSVFLQKIIHEHEKRGWRVYCTDQSLSGLHIPASAIGKYRFDKKYNNLLVVDEASTIWNSRDFKNFGNDKIDFFKKHRHQHVRIVLASQDYADVDKIIRKLTDRYYLVSRFAGLWVKARRIRKDVKLTEAIGEQGGTIAEQYVYESIFKSAAIQFAFLPHWVKTFDSYADLGAENLPFIDELLEVAPPDLKSGANSLDDEIIEDYSEEVS